MKKQNVKNDGCVITVTATRNGNYRFSQEFTSIDSAIRCSQMSLEHKNLGLKASITVNGITLPDIEKDETFFYASFAAAKEGKVWNEYTHSFTSRAALGYMESDCLCDSDWEHVRKDFLENIRKDISGEVPVTCDEVPDELGVARVYDKDLADLCKDNGFDVLPCGSGEVNEDGEYDEYYLIFNHGGEDEYFDNLDEDAIFWEYVPETHESVFEAPMIHAVWDAYEGDGCLFFGKPSKAYGGFKIESHVDGITAFNQMEAVIRTVLNDPDDIEVRDGVIYRRLEKMPTAVWNESTWSFDIPTGWEYLDKCGTRWTNEYETVQR